MNTRTPKPTQRVRKYDPGVDLVRGLLVPQMRYVYLALRLTATRRRILAIASPISVFRCARQLHAMLSTLK
jgi:hypothetical protein